LIQLNLGVEYRPCLPGTGSRLNRKPKLRRKEKKMYAVIATGGKQYRVSEGDEVRVEKLAGASGDKVVFDQVLMLGQGSDSKIGAPTVKNAKVEAEIVAQDRAKKIIVFKFKRRKKYRLKQGHRQPFTQLKITKISA